MHSGLATLKSAPNIITDLPLLLPNTAGCNLHSSVFKQNHGDKVDPVERKRHNQTTTEVCLNLMPESAQEFDFISFSFLNHQYPHKFFFCAFFFYLFFVKITAFTLSVF